MAQQLIAFGVILFMLIKLLLQRQKKDITTGEFYFWLFFWLGAFVAILFLKKIDFFVRSLGFSASGIDILLYLSVIFLFSAVFQLRLKIEKQDRIITKIVREVSLFTKK